MNRIMLMVMTLVLTVSTPWQVKASEPWQVNFSEPVTAVARSIQWLDDFLLWIITAICIFCFIILGYIAVRFNHKNNPKPSAVTHHTGLEVAWTLIPILILVVIAVPSFRLLDDQLIIPDGERTYDGEVLPAPGLTVKVTGYTWYWNYEYPGDNDTTFDFDSLLISGDELAEKRKADPEGDYPTLLSVDNEMVVPVNTTVRLLLTSDPDGVIHSWFVPQFGVKGDVVPGRTNQLWFHAEKEGFYYGGCAELCGKDHSRMPVVVRVVSQEAYQDWLKKKIEA